MVEIGLMCELVCEFNVGFFCCIGMGCLFVWVKLVMSLDGCIVLVNGVL